MKKSFLFLSIIAGVALSSCSVTRPYEVTNNSLGSKKGESSTVALFGFGSPNIYAGYSSTGLILNKNYGIVEAAKNGKITKVGSVDLKVSSYVLFKKFTLIVKGE